MKRKRRSRSVTRVEITGLPEAIRYAVELMMDSWNLKCHLREELDRIHQHLTALEQVVYGEHKKGL